MDLSYSLGYFEKICGRRGPEFWELVGALEEQLESYASDLPAACAAGDPEVLRNLRHTHRPMVQNLGLTGLQAREAELQAAVLAGAPEPRLRELAAGAAALARAVARGLAEERSRSGF